MGRLRKVRLLEDEMRQMILTGVDIDRLAAYFEAQDVKKGETVAVFTTNSPEMYIAVLALSKLGVVAGLVNINLRGMSGK
jgi:acyl-coenzyme A synthetase/AMP-(fatty) acid ligase